MFIVKNAVLQCHYMAKELNDISDIALCNADGQACSVVHTQKHAMGYPVYELTAIVREDRLPTSIKSVEQGIDYYTDRLSYWQNEMNRDTRTWADFIR